VTDRYTFADTVEGLLYALETTLTKRAYGFRTYLETHEIGHTVVHTVVAVPPPRPNRAERGCALNRR